MLVDRRDRERIAGQRQIEHARGELEKESEAERRPLEHALALLESGDVAMRAQERAHRQVASGIVARAATAPAASAEARDRRRATRPAPCCPSGMPAEPGRVAERRGAAGAQVETPERHRFPAHGDRGRAAGRERRGGTERVHEQVAAA